MIKALSISPPANSVPFTPAENYELAAGASETLEFRGLNRQRYGFDRIVPYANLPAHVTLTAELNNEKILFRNVNVLALTRLFLHRHLIFPWVIRSANVLRVTVTNTHPTDTAIGSVMLNGVDEPYLAKMEAAYQDAGIPTPSARLLYGNATIPAQANDFAVNVEQPANDVLFRSMAIGTTSDSDILVKMEIWTEKMKDLVFAEQINNEYSSLRSRVNFKLSQNTPFTLKTTNLNATDSVKFTYIAEAYDVE